MVTLAHISRLMVSHQVASSLECVIMQPFTSLTSSAGLHKLWYPVVRDRSTWSKFGAHGEHGDVFLFSNLGAL